MKLMHDISKSLYEKINYILKNCSLIFIQFLVKCMIHGILLFSICCLVHVELSCLVYLRVCIHGFLFQAVHLVTLW